MDLCALFELQSSERHLFSEEKDGLRHSKCFFVSMAMKPFDK